MKAQYAILRFAKYKSQARSSTVLSSGTAWPVMTEVGWRSKVKAAGTASSRPAAVVTA